MRALIGFLIAPGLPGLAVYLIGLSAIPGWEAAWWSMMFALSGYIAALVLGIPAHFMLRRKGARGLMTYVATGTLIGLACYVLMFGVEALVSWQSNPEHSIELLKNTARLAAIAVVYGAAASGVFWFIAIRRTISSFAPS